MRILLRQLLTTRRHIRTDVQAAINFGELNGEAAAPPDRGGTTAPSCWGDRCGILSCGCECIRRRRSNHRLTVRINRFSLGLNQSIHGGGRRCRG
jgi:hypothetical protein